MDEQLSRPQPGRDSIVVHEAGHAFVAHLMGDSIVEVVLVPPPGENPRTVIVGPLAALETYAAGEMACRIIGVPSCLDWARSDSAMIQAFGSIRRVPGFLLSMAMNRWAPAFEALRERFGEAFDTGASKVPGSEIHALLTGLDCPFGGAIVSG